MSVSWTKEQQKVIDVRHRDVLVSAAAGSGKTAVLVERILSLVCGEKEGEEPVDVDRLLVVTFTRAAAAEMRERIGLALEKRLLADPDNVHLQKQQMLIHHAQITTIDSFCQYVIRNYFHEIDLDPSFRIGEDGELKLLRMDVLQELLEEAYAEARPEFIRFVEEYATRKKDSDLETIILQLYDASQSNPNPARWLEECGKGYEMQTAEELEQSVWGQYLLQVARQTLMSLEQELLGGLALCRDTDGPYMYEPAVSADLDLVRGLGAADSIRTLQEGLSALSYARLSSKKDENVDPDKKEAIKALRTRMKNALKELKERYFAADLEEDVHLLQLAAPSTRELLRLTAAFAERFREKKRQKNLADFSDLEHLALEILTREEQEEDGSICYEPTDAARELAGHYVQIMIDEYQDSNLLQEVLLNSVSRGQGEPNVFMVGDVKQSIYRFRQARPELFMEKYNTWPQTEDTQQTDRTRIDLHRNFRSRPEVLEGANSLFARLMIAEVGGVRYDDAAALRPGAEWPAIAPVTDTDKTDIVKTDADGVGLNIDTVDENTEGQNGRVIQNTSDLYAPELWLMDIAEAQDEDDAEAADRTARELEAALCADCIHEQLEHGRIWDRDRGEYRPVQCRDIVILLRSLTGWGDTFARVLNAAGIPAHTESRTGYFNTVEIQTMLNLLRIVDNPRQDIPLTAVLRSMIGGFSDADLAEVRRACPEGDFHQAVLRYRTEGGNDRLRERLDVFFTRLSGYRSRAEYLSVHELIELLLEDTGYGDYLAARPGGEQREANVRMLIARAISFEKTSYRGLFHFVRYIEQLQSYQEDFGEAGILSEQEDAVRILTIHKSKGLEFPIVLVAGLGKSFNRQDSQGRVLLHAELGIGVDWVDPKRRTRRPTFLKRVLRKAQDLEMLGEELRVLYVACTRAKEKLILLGGVKDLDKALQKYQSQEGAEVLPFGTVSTAGTYLDWILPAAAVQPDTPFMTMRKTPQEQAAEAVADQLRREELREELEHPESLPEADADYAKDLARSLSYVYPWQAEQGLRAKISVSELKKLSQLEEEDRDTLIYPEEAPVPYIPHFMQTAEPVSGAARGTAYHRALECLDPARLYHSEQVKKELELLVQQGKMTREQADAVWPYDLYVFAQSNLGKRMSRARREGRFRAEQPFVLAVPACEIDPMVTTEEPVLVQGIIDAYFEEEDGLVLADYKTDRVERAEELLERYSSQLDYYQMALERLTGKRVKEKLLYSFCLKQEIPVPLK